MASSLPSLLLSLPASLVARAAYAWDCVNPDGSRCLPVDIGSDVSVWELAQRIVTFLSASIGLLAAAMFVVGALYLTVTGANEDYKRRGKDLMVGSAISIAVVLGAYAILRTVDCFLTEGCFG